MSSTEGRRLYHDYQDLMRYRIMDILLVSTPYDTFILEEAGELAERMLGEFRNLDLHYAPALRGVSSGAEALRIARERGIPSIRRDVFLDPDRRLDTVEREFARLKSIAQARGYAVGIGHPYPETLDFLDRALPGLDAEGFVLVPISELVTQLDRQGLDPRIASGE